MKLTEIELLHIVELRGNEARNAIGELITYNEHSRDKVEYFLDKQNKLRFALEEKVSLLIEASQALHAARKAK